MSASSSQIQAQENQALIQAQLDNASSSNPPHKTDGPHGHGPVDHGTFPGDGTLSPTNQAFVNSMQTWGKGCEVSNTNSSNYNQAIALLGSMPTQIAYMAIFIIMVMAANNYNDAGANQANSGSVVMALSALNGQAETQFSTLEGDMQTYGTDYNTYQAAVKAYQANPTQANENAMGAAYQPMINAANQLGTDAVPFCKDLQDLGIAITATSVGNLPGMTPILSNDQRTQMLGYVNGIATGLGAHPTDGEPPFMALTPADVENTMAGWAQQMQENGGTIPAGLQQVQTDFSAITTECGVVSQQATTNQNFDIQNGSKAFTLVYQTLSQMLTAELKSIQNQNTN
ncbi:MAG: hypothetical protein V4492_00115 [Chlamydiota bacterium]